MRVEKCFLGANCRYLKVSYRFRVGSRKEEG